MRSRLLLFAPLVVAASVVVAQPASEAVEVRVIEVPVTVHDRAGNAIRGLTAANFEITVDGRRVPIDHFEVVDVSKRVEPAAAPAGDVKESAVPPAAYRNFLLFFDRANSSPGLTRRAQEAAKGFIANHLTERDLAAVATYTVERGAQMVTSFTRDREFLTGAIDTLGDDPYFKAADPLFLASRIPTMAQGMGGMEGQRRRAADEDDRQLTNRIAATSHANEMRSRIRMQLENLGGVARALDRLHGQKQVILLSEGFDARLITGRDDLSFQNTQAENDAVMSGELWRVDADQRFGTATETREISDMVELFRRSDVRLHAIDIKGVRTDVDAREGLKKQNNDALFMLTEPTGGTVFRNTNDLSAQFSQLVRQQEVIYLLGFRARGGAAGQFHPLRVKLVDAKGEVAHRTGYYDSSPAMSNLETALTFSQMLMTRERIDDVPLRLSATPVPGTDRTARVPVIVEIAGSGLLEGINSSVATATIFVYAFEAGGQARDFLQQRAALDTKKTGDALRATGVRYVSALRLLPGTYTVKALVRVDETGRTGLTTSRVVVPEFGAAAVLRPVAVGDVGSWLTIVSPSRGADATRIMTMGERPFVPHARLEIAAGGSQQIALMLRGVSVDNLAITPTLVAPDGSTRAAPVTLAGRTSADADGIVKLLFDFNAASVPRGEYELKFSVAPAGSQTSVVGLPVIIR